MTNASKKMENISSDSIVVWTLRFLSMAAAAGAIIDEAIGVMNVIRETSPVTSHLLLKDHVLGFAGSWGPSHIT
jgi:hypothetical protein